MSQNLKKKTAKAVGWSAVERFSLQTVGFITGLLIARQLAPSDYGVIAMTSIFFAISSTFIDSGFSSALIRKNDRTESDNSTVFYFNIVIGAIATLLVFFSAPLVAKFYDQPLLVPIMRVLSFRLIIGSFNGVQQAILSARIDFKSQAKIAFTSNILASVVALTTAYMGWGVWALVAQSITSTITRTVMLWTTVRWYPTMPFSKKSFDELFGYGSKLLASALLDTTYSNIYTIVIGKVFSAGELGVYSRASNLSKFPSENITGIIQRVTFPVLSKMQDEDERLSINYRKLLQVSAFLVFPLMIGLSAIASPLIVTILTPKWSGAIVYLQILCFSMMWYPIHAINLNLLQVKGRSDLFLRLEVIKKIIGVTVLVTTIPMGLVVMCYGRIFSSLICLIVNTHYTGKLINVDYFKQMGDLLPALLGSLAMGGVVYFTTTLIDSPSLQLGAGVVVGAATYTMIALIFRFREVGYLKELIKK